MSHVDLGDKCCFPWVLIAPSACLSKRDGSPMTCCPGALPLFVKLHLIICCLFVSWRINQKQVWVQRFESLPSKPKKDTPLGGLLRATGVSKEGTVLQDHLGRL